MWKLKLTKYYLAIFIAITLISLLAGRIWLDDWRWFQITLLLIALFVVTYPIIVLIYFSLKSKVEIVNAILILFGLIWVVLILFLFLLYMEPFFGGSWG